MDSSLRLWDWKSLIGFMNLVKTNGLQHTLVLNNQLTSSSTDGVRTLMRYCALYTPTDLQEKQQHAIYQSLLFTCQIGFLSCGSQMITWTGEGALRASKLFVLSTSLSGSFPSILALIPKHASLIYLFWGHRECSFLCTPLLNWGMNPHRL